MKVEKTQQNTPTNVKLPSKVATIRSTQQKGITEIREKTRADKERTLPKTVSIINEKKTGSFFTNKRKDTSKNNRGGLKRERREIKSVETKG